MEFEIPAYSVHIPDFFIDLWWLWLIVMILFYFLWSVGKDNVNQEKPFLKKIGGYTILSIGWLGSLIAFFASLISGIINILVYLK